MFSGEGCDTIKNEERKSGARDPDAPIKSSRTAILEVAQRAARGGSGRSFMSQTLYFGGPIVTMERELYVQALLTEGERIPLRPAVCTARRNDGKDCAPGGA